MKKAFLLALTLSVTGILATQKASAQFAVFDATTFGEVAENVAQAVQQVQQTMQMVQMAKNGMVPQLLSMATGQSGTKQIAFQMAKLVDLDSFGQVLAQRPDGSVYAASADTLTYNPADASNGNGGFSGGNQSFTQNIVGGNNLPIGLDDTPPCSVLPVSSANSALAQKVAGTYKDPNGSVTSLNNLFGPSAVTSLLGPLQSSVPTSTSQATQLQIGDGLFVRPYAGQNDDIQAAYGNSADPNDVITYYGAVTKSGSSYHPIFGNNAPGAAGQVMSGLLSNVLTGGQYGAVNQYLQSNGGGSNPYSSFGGDMAPTAASLLSSGSITVGQPLVLSSNQVSQSSSSSLNTSKAPSLFANVNGSSSNSPTATSSTGNYVVVQTLSKADLNQFNTIMRLSDEMIRNNWRESQKAQALVTYTTTLLGSATTTTNSDGSTTGASGLLGQQAQLQQIRDQMAGTDSSLTTSTPSDNGGDSNGSDSSSSSSANPTQSIAEITQALAALQAEITSRQEFCSQMQLKVADLATERSKMLTERAEKRYEFAKQMPQATTGLTGDSYIQSAQNNILASASTSSSSSSTTSSSTP